MFAGPQQVLKDLRDRAAARPPECQAKLFEQRIDGDNRAVMIAAGREAHHRGDDPVEAVDAERTGSFVEQGPGGLARPVAFVQVYPASVGLFFQKQVDDLPSDEVVLVHQVHVSRARQPAALSEETSEYFQPVTVPEVSELQLGRLGQPGAPPQLADYLFCRSVIDSHRSDREVRVGAVV